MAKFGPFKNYVPGAITCALSGTATSTIDEDAIVTGGNTIILTLTGGYWAASGVVFDAVRQSIIDGIDSAQSEAAGWDAEVKTAIPVGNVVRTSSTVVTITLPAIAGYDITAQETITATVPQSAVQGASSGITASPAFTVDEVVALPVWSVVTGTDGYTAKIVSPDGEFTGPSSGHAILHFANGQVLDFTTGFDYDSGGDTEKTFAGSPSLFVSRYSFRPGRYNLNVSSGGTAALASDWNITIGEDCEIEFV